jgi:hypothetical protein
MTYELSGAGILDSVQFYPRALLGWGALPSRTLLKVRRLGMCMHCQPHCQPHLRLHEGPKTWIVGFASRFSKEGSRVLSPEIMMSLQTSEMNGYRSSSLLCNHSYVAV